MHFGRFCRFGYLRVPVVPDFWGEVVECLCVMARLHFQLCLSAPLLRFLVEYGQLCLDLWLACVLVVFGLLWMWGAVVVGMGELWGREGVLPGVVHLPSLSLL